MFHSIPARWLATLTTLGALGVSAQTRPASGPIAAPAAVRAVSGAETYRSALEGYQPFTEEKVLPWKETNDTVGRVGGWKVYAREAQGEGAEMATKPPAADPHAGPGEKSK